jgi:uncharacterized protein YcfL
MIKHSLLLIISLFFIAACSSQNEQGDPQKQAPQAAIESMDSSVIKEESELNKSKTLKRAPIILINPEDDDMTRLD